MSRPINLTTITERSTLAQINSNFRKIQTELSGFRQNVEPRLRASEAYQDYFSRYLGGGRPISRQQAIEYTDEQIAAKEAEILDELESRTGNIGEKIEELEQLGEDLIDRISTADEIIENHAETIEAIENDLSNTRDRLEEKADLLWTEAQLALKADQSLFEETVSSLEDVISEKADAEWVDGRLKAKADADNTYTKQEVDNALNSKVSLTEYTVDKEGFIERFENNESRIEQTEEAISQTVTKTEFEEVQNDLGEIGTRLSNAETSITQNAEAIELRATKEEVDGLEDRIGVAETAITQNAEQIELRATKTELSELEDRVDSAETSITQNAEEIQLRATKAEFEELSTDISGISDRLSYAETAITQNSEAIELRATKTEVERLEDDLGDISSRVSEAETLITQNAEQIELRATKSELDEVTDRVSTAETAITQNAEAIEQRATKTEVDELSGDVSSLSSTVSQHANLIEQKVDSTTYTQDMEGVIQQLSNHSTAITQNAEAIELKASQTEVDALNDTVSQHAAQLAVHADAIEAKVDSLEYEQDQEGIIQRIEANEAEIRTTAQGLELRVTKEEFENLEIGGRNLIRNSDFSNGSDYWEGQFSLTEEGALLQSTVGATHLIQNTTEIPEGDYIVQIWYEVLEGQAPYLFADNGTDMSTPNRSVFDINKNYISFPITVKSKSRLYAIRYASASPTDHLEGKTIIKRIKLEKGNKATDWTPAPEDTDEAITAVSNRVSQTETTLTAHAGLIEAKAEKSEVYTRSQVDDALGEKIDTTIFNEQIGTLTTSINSISGRVSSTEAEINSLTGELENVENRISSVEVTTDGITQSVSSIEGQLSNVGNRLSQAETSITSLADEIELKASQTEVDTLEGRMSEAEASISVLPGQIEARVEKDGVIGAINASPEELLIEFDRIRIEGMLEARHIRSLAGLNINNQFIVDSQGNVSFGGRLQGSSGTFGEVTVNEGDITIKDANSNVEQLLTPLPNLLADHSFEEVSVDWTTEDERYNWYDMVNPPYAEFDFGTHKPYWIKSGSPKVAKKPYYGVVDYRALPIFDQQAIVVRNANYVRQYIAEGIGAGGTYTISGYFKRHWGHAAGVPRFEVDHMRSGQRVSRLINHTYDRVPNNYTVVRFATTFTLPSNFQEGDYLDIKVSGGDSNWVQCDGIQLVEGNLPCIYNPETTAYEAKRVAEILTDPLWTGQAYPLDTQTIYPALPINQCKTGWVLKFQRYVVGEGTRNSHYQYVHIPKVHVLNHDGAGLALALGFSNSFPAYRKYIYVYTNRIVGNADNNQGGSQHLALTGVYEY